MCIQCTGTSDQLQVKRLEFEFMLNKSKFPVCLYVSLYKDFGQIILELQSVRYRTVRTRSDLARNRRQQNAKNEHSSSLVVENKGTHNCQLRANEPILVSM
jgi:hypothetical protein